MLCSADAALAARDPGMPGLATLLDPDAVSAWLARGAPEPPVAARRRYLRYKPGTSCVLEVDLTGSEGPDSCIVTAYTEHAAHKLLKTVEQAPRGSVLALDEQRRLLATTPAADRDLPALAVLCDPRRRRRLLRRLLPERTDLHDATLTPLRHKPQRRWVGTVQPRVGPPALLRVHRPADAAHAVTAIRELAGGPPLTPQVIGADLDLGVTVVEFLPGQALDRLLTTGEAGPAGLRAAGAALAALHERTLVALRERPADADAEAVLAAARQVGVLLPGLAGAAAGLGEVLAGRLRGLPPVAVAVHGDFSADQVVLGEDGRAALVDLDSAVLGDPAVDLGCAFAALTALTVLEPGPIDEHRWLAALHEGYRGVRPLPDPERLATHSAALLLRRAADPFRRCAPDWPSGVRALLARAVALQSSGKAPRVAGHVAS